jgi:hypothetical protein
MTNLRDIRKWEKMIGRSVTHCKRADGRLVCALTSKDAVWAKLSFTCNQPSKGTYHDEVQ